MFVSLCGLVVATFILSLKTGLILGMSRNNSKQLWLFSLVFSLTLGVLVMIFLPMQSLIVNILDKYTFIGSISIAFFLIYLGLNGELDTVEIRSANKFNRKYAIALLPCPLCLIALALTVLIMGPGINIAPWVLGWIISGVFFLMLAAIAFGTRIIMKKFATGPENILNGFLLFLGIFTLCCGLFIPSFVKSMTMPFVPIILESGVWTWGAISGMVILLITGYVKHNLFEEKGERG